MSTVGFCAKPTAISPFTSGWLSSGSFQKSFAMVRSRRRLSIDFGEFMTLKGKGAPVLNELSTTPWRRMGIGCIDQRVNHYAMEAYGDWMYRSTFS
jgi:hypothetical protein